MNLYRVSRTDKVGYDEYDSFICFAYNEDQARTLHPSMYGWGSSTWIPEEARHTLKVELIKPGITQRVLLASFNAG